MCRTFAMTHVISSSQYLLYDRQFFSSCSISITTFPGISVCFVYNWLLYATLAMFGNACYIMTPFLFQTQVCESLFKQNKKVTTCKTPPKSGPRPSLGPIRRVFLNQPFCLSSWRLGFYTTPIHAGFMECKVTLKWVFIALVGLFSSVGIISVIILKIRISYHSRYRTVAIDNIVK